MRRGGFWSNILFGKLTFVRIVSRKRRIGGE
jgi:hypothetical protein